MLRALGFFGDRFLRLPLGADEQDVLALRRHLAHERSGVLEHLQRLLQIDDVDSVTFAEDVFFHLRIPALGLVPEVNAGFEQFLQNSRQTDPSGFVNVLPPGFAARPTRLDGCRTQCMSRSRLAAVITLGELEALARALLPVLLPLLDPRVARQKAQLSSVVAQFDVELDQRAGNAQPERAGLAGRGRRRDVRMRMSNLSAVSVASSGCRTGTRKASVGK